MNVKTVVLLNPDETRDVGANLLLCEPLPDGLLIKPTPAGFTLTNTTAELMRVWFTVRGKRAELVKIPTEEFRS